MCFDYGRAETSRMGFTDDLLIHFNYKDQRMVVHASIDGDDVVLTRVGRTYGAVSCMGRPDMIWSVIREIKSRRLPVPANIIDRVICFDGSIHLESKICLTGELMRCWKRMCRATVFHLPYYMSARVGDADDRMISRRPTRTPDSLSFLTLSCKDRLAVHADASQLARRDART